MDFTSPPPPSAPSPPDRSRYRCRHYLPQLQPIMPILQPVIERLGYTV
jgi:hypothetical protein